MGLEEQIAADLRANLFSDGYPSETVTYTPKGGAPKSIKAVVTRNPMRQLGNGVREMPAHTVEIRIQRDATYGIATVKPEHDVVNLPLHVGGVAEDFVVVRVIKENAFMWHLECYRG